MVFLLALAAVESASAECPVDTVTAHSSFSGTVTHTTSMPTDGVSRFDSGRYCTDYCYSWYVDSDAKYDLVAGTMYADVVASGAGDGEAIASTHDVFTLLGPAAAPPVTFHAHVSAGAAILCGGGFDAQADASIREGASSSASVVGSRDACLGPTDLAVSIARAAGTTFDLYLTVHAKAGSNSIFGPGGDAHASLSLSFPDLPVGYSVVSCQGFAAGQVTAAKRSSWGALKTLYR